MIFSAITQSGTKIDTLNNTIYQYSDNLTFQFLRDAKFNEYTLGAYINYDDKIYGLEVSEDDTFKVDSRFLDDKKEFLLSFSLTSGEEIIHLGTIKYRVKEAFGSITSPLPKPKEIWESFVEEKVDSYFLENYQSKLDDFNTKYDDTITKYNEIVETSTEQLKENIAESKNDAIKQIQSEGQSYQDQINKLQKSEALQDEVLDKLNEEVDLKVTQPYLNNNDSTHITSSDNGSLKNIVVKGNTVQNSTNGYQLFNINDVIDGYIEDGGTLSVDTANNEVASNDFLPIDSSKGTVTLRIEATVSNNYNWGAIAYYDENKTFISRFVLTGVNGTGVKDENKTFAIPSNAKYFKGSFRKYNDGQMQIEYGDTAHDFEVYTGGQPSPNPDYPQEVKGVSEISGKIVGKNLFDQKLLLDIKNLDTRYGPQGLYLYTLEVDETKDVYIKINYKDHISYYLASMAYSYNNMNHWFIHPSSYTTPDFKYKSTDHKGKILIGVNSNMSKIKEMLDIIGDIVVSYEPITDYQPYQSQSFNYTLSNPLYRLSDSVYDYIDVDKGKIVRNVAKKTLDGSENNWIFLANKENTKIFSSRLYDIKADSKLLCENLQYANDDSEKITCSNTDVYIGILKSRLEDTTVDEFKKFLSIHPIIIYYALAESIEENIPVDLLEQLEKIKSYYPQTNIMFDTEVEPYINFDYKLNLKSWIEDKDNKEIIYDKQNKEKDKYSSTFFENMFALQRTGEVYTVKFPKWETSHISTGEKLDANAGLVCEPSTKTIKGQNDYANIPLFKTYDVDAYVDNDGVRHVTAIKGDKDFKDEGKVDVFVLGMSYYEKVWEDEQYWYYSRTDSPRDGYTVARECINRDGSIQPFALYSKYVSGFIDKVPYSSKGLIPGRVYSSTPLPSEDSFSANNSYTNMIANYHKKGNFYCGGMTCDYKYILSTFYLKYATLNTQSIMYGCANCNFQYKASIQSKDKNTYFPVTKSQATQIEIGSSVSVGYQSKFSSTITVDRAYSNTHRYADDVKVLKKEDIDDNNVAIYLDIDEPFNTIPITIADGVESEIYISSMHWQSGFSDDVLDRDGCPCETKTQLTNGKFPMVIQGIEIMVGGYETYANAFMDIVDATGKREIYIQNDASQLTTNVTTAKTFYKKSQYAIQPSKVNNWNYITRIDFDLENGAFIQTECGQASSGTGVGFSDGVYVDASSTGQIEFLALGYLWSGGSAGLSSLDAHYGLGSANWRILSRLSINGVGGELTTG